MSKKNRQKNNKQRNYHAINSFLNRKAGAMSSVKREENKEQQEIAKELDEYYSQLSSSDDH